MLDTKDFNFFENQTNFDFKGFFLKILSFWKWFIISVLICLFIAYQTNIRKQKIYGIESSIVVKDENNSMFSSNTSLIFNWGGVSDKVQTFVTTLKSRSHNEQVVEKLDFYIDYLIQGKYELQDAYGEVPFRVKIDKRYPQLANVPIKIHFTTANTFNVELLFESTSVQVIDYSQNKISEVKIAQGNFKKTYQVGSNIKLPFLNLTLNLNPDAVDYVGREYFIKFNDFNGVVANYKSINVEPDMKAGSVIKLGLTGTNKNRLVDYLNETVHVLKKNQLENKNQFAINTIRFIDSTLVAMENAIKDSEDELNKFRSGKRIYDIENGGDNIVSKITELDVQRDGLQRKIAYYNSLNSYLNKSSDYSKLPAPTVAGIEDVNIVTNVSQLINLSKERAAMAYSVKNEKMFRDFDKEMEAYKKVLLENISAAKGVLQQDLSQVSGKIGSAEGSIQNLPEEQQQMLKITRKYELSRNIYDAFLAKKTEANIIKASNVSDIQFIDSAKDVGGGLVGPKTSVNYIVALFFGLLIPFIIVLILILLDNTISNIEDLKRLTKIPVIGVVGKKNTDSNLSVFEKPKSPLAESFRSIRSSLQFMYNQSADSGSKILMLTSSVGGEGKTFNSINLATVFAMSGKKTVIVGLDLRKPKIFGDFNIKNENGVVNYLIGQKQLSEIVDQSVVENLDIIISGPIPPNPSELILSQKMSDLITELKGVYEYIILDTPPIGLVADAMELVKFTDAVIYITRQGYTKKAMVGIINEKYKRGEIKNVSIILNDYVNKENYGYGYGAGYGYGYGTYGDGYVEKVAKEKFLTKFKKKNK